jgi:hypothetical protein
MQGQIIFVSLQSIAAFYISESKNFGFPLELFPGPDPTIASYNASVVKFYNATSSLARFVINFLYFKKRSM